MRVIKLIILLLILVSFNAHAVDPWYISGNAALFADYMQTMEIARNPDFEEGNLILGSNPSPGVVNFYFSSIFLVYNAINYAFDNEYVDTLNKTVTIVESAVVITNSYQGVKFKLKF